MSQNVPQQDEKENTFLFLCLWSVVIRLPESFSFGSSDLFACLTGMLLFANYAVIIIALILAICEITWKTEDGEENNSSLSEILTTSLCIYAWYICRSFWENLRVLLWFRTYLPKRGFLIKHVFSFSTLHCMAILLYISNNNLWKIIYLYISITS